jgi:retinol dehydrogenase 12
MSSLSRLLGLTPAPAIFTPNSLLDLSSKVYIISECTAETNVSLARTLYNLHATVYLGISSLAEYNDLDTQLKQQCPDSKGSLRPLVFNITDLESIHGAVQAFLQDQWRLDLLFLHTHASTSHELRTACLPSFLLARLLLPIMHSTASNFCHPNPSIRIIWSADSNQSRMQEEHATNMLGLLAHEFSRRKYIYANNPHAHTLPNSNPLGVQHVIVNSPASRLAWQSSMDVWIPKFIKGPDHRLSALLYAGLSPDVKSGDVITHWGKKGQISQCIDATKRGEKGENTCQALFEWCNENVASFTGYTQVEGSRTH